MTITTTEETARDNGGAARRRTGVKSCRALELLNALAVDAVNPYPTRLFDRWDLAGPERADDGPDDPDAVTAARRISSLLDGHRQRAAQAVPLLKTARELLSCPDAGSVLRVAVRHARRILAFDAAFVAWPDAQGRCVRFPAADGMHRLRDRTTTAVDGTGLGALALEGHGVAWTPDYLTDPSIPHSAETDALVADEGLRCMAAVPLHRRGCRSGLLFLAQRREHHLSPDELTFLTDFAELVSEALDALPRSGAVPTADGPGPPLSGAEIAEFCTGLFDAALGPRGAQGVLARATSVLGGPALLRSVSGTVLAQDGEMPPQVLDAVGAAIPEVVDGRGSVRLAKSGRVTAVTTDDAVLGFLVTAVGGTDAGGAPQLLTLVARALATAIVRARAEAVPADAGDGVLDALCSARPHAVPHLVEAAAERGVTVVGSHVLVARPADGSVSWVTNRLRSAPPRPEHLSTVRDGDVVVLIGAEDGGRAARRLAEHLGAGTGRRITVGASGPVAAPDAVDEARLAATRCVDALVTVEGPGAAGSLAELGFLGVALTGGGDLRSFSDAQLDAVTRHDERTSGAMADTLEAYFAANRSIAQAASALYVHPNTVARRLERLGELLGDDWQSPQRALDIQIALLVRRTRGVVTGHADP